MSALLTIENVSVAFAQRRPLFARKSRSLLAVDDVSAEIAEGETLALVEQIGLGQDDARPCGRRACASRAPGKCGCAACRAWSRKRASGTGRGIQIVFQDPFSALDPRMPVSDIIAEPLRIQSIGSKRERRERAALARRAGRPARATRSTATRMNSRGGQRQPHRDRPGGCPGAGTDRRG